MSGLEQQFSSSFVNFERGEEDIGQGYALSDRLAILTRRRRRCARCRAAACCSSWTAAARARPSRTCTRAATTRPWACTAASPCPSTSGPCSSTRPSATTTARWAPGAPAAALVCGVPRGTRGERRSRRPGFESYEIVLFSERVIERLKLFLSPSTTIDPLDVFFLPWEFKTISKTILKRRAKFQAAPVIDV